MCPQELNLSYQDLGDPFQRDNFLRILRRLIRVEKLQLVSDWLTDLSSVRLPRLETRTQNAPQQASNHCPAWTKVAVEAVAGRAGSPELRFLVWSLWSTCSASCSLARCKMLHLQQNHLVGVHQLPKLPLVEHLCLSDNTISSLGGLGALGKTPLRSLSLIRNPVSFMPDYRAR